MSDLSELTSEFLKDPEFRKEYKTLQFERDAAMVYVMAGKKAKHPDKQQDEKTKIGLENTDTNK